MALLPPLLQLAASQPQMLAEHAGAWGQLLAAECAPAAQAWRRKLGWQLAAGVTALLGLGLAGVACMLWAVAPPANPLRLALLWGTPALPLLVAVFCAWQARRCSQDAAHSALARLRRQWRADMALLWPADPAGPAP